MKAKLNQRGYRKLITFLKRHVDDGYEVVDSHDHFQEWVLEVERNFNADKDALVVEPYHTTTGDRETCVFSMKDFDYIGIVE